MCLKAAFPVDGAVSLAISESSKPPAVPNNASQVVANPTTISPPPGKTTAAQQLSRISEDSKQSHLLSPQVEDPPTTLNLLIPAPPVPAGPQPRFVPLLQSCRAS